MGPDSEGLSGSHGLASGLMPAAQCTPTPGLLAVVLWDGEGEGRGRGRGGGVKGEVFSCI